MRHFVSSAFVCCTITLLSACNSVQTRNQNATSLAANSGFDKATYVTHYFSLVAYQKLTSTQATVSIFIEGDGLAWKTKTQISTNPTPRDPVGMRIAFKDTSKNIIYLARPCQFVDIEQEKNCVADYWTSKRASREVIDSYHEALNILRDEHGLNQFRLVGYSGGGTIAAILTAERDDVIDLRTVVGNLDIDKFSEVHQVSALTGSINPANLSDKLLHIPQIHFVADGDMIITSAITDSYVQHIEQTDPELTCINVKTVPDTTHAKNWDTQWRQLSQLIPACR